jgi:hypothetical protein
VSAVVRNASGLEALRRLADAGLVTLAAFTPSDAMHVLDRQQRLVPRGGRVRGAHSRDRGAQCARRGRRVLAAGFCERTYEHVVRETGRALLEAALAHDPGLEVRDSRWGCSAIGSSRQRRRAAALELMRATLGLARPLVAIGAPVGAYYPEVARRLGARSAFRSMRRSAMRSARSRAWSRRPSRSWSISRPSTCFACTIRRAARTIRIRSPRSIMRERVSRELALGAARRAGAADPHVETSVSEKLAQWAPAPIISPRRWRARRPPAGRSRAAAHIG